MSTGVTDKRLRLVVLTIAPLAAHRLPADRAAAHLLVRGGSCRLRAGAARAHGSGSRDAALLGVLNGCLAEGWIR